KASTYGDDYRRMRLLRVGSDGLAGLDQEFPRRCIECRARADHCRRACDGLAAFAAHLGRTARCTMMSPTLAMADGTVLAYVVLVGTLMAAIGLLLVLLTYAFGIRLGSVWRTYRSWLVMVPIVLAVLLAGRVATILSVAAAAMFAFREFAR